MTSRRRETSSSSRKVDDDIRTKEEEQRRLNEELEARTAMLVKETENALREHEEIFSKKHSMLDNVELHDQYLDWDRNDSETRNSLKRTSVPNKGSKKAPESSRGSARQQKMKAPMPKMAQPKVTHNIESTSYAQGEKGFEKDNADDNDSREFILGAISNVDISLDGGKNRRATQVLDDVVPAIANELGSENLIRFLKAKLQVTQEEVGRLSHELSARDDSLQEVLAKLKDADEERARLQRTNTAQQTQMQKHKKVMEEARERADSLDVQLTACKKELDSMKKNQKQQATSQGTLEVRLNRALEECEKYKAQLEKVKAGTKENVEVERRRLEELTMENKRLEKQKNELMNGYKKQLKLIDILKRKQMHIEAAKMLSFTEEEFVKAMEWGSN